MPFDPAFPDNSLAYWVNQFIGHTSSGIEYAAGYVAVLRNDPGVYLEPGELTRTEELKLLENEIFRRLNKVEWILRELPAELAAVGFDPKDLFVLEYHLKGFFFENLPAIKLLWPNLMASLRLFLIKEPKSAKSVQTKVQSESPDKSKTISRRKPAREKHLGWKALKDKGLSYGDIVLKHKDETGEEITEDRVKKGIKRLKDVGGGH